MGIPGPNDPDTAYPVVGSQVIAYEWGSQLALELPEDQVGAAHPVIAITRDGEPQLSIYGNGDVKIMNSYGGLILSSPNGTAYRVTVNNTGDLNAGEVQPGDEGTLGAI